MNNLLVFNAGSSSLKFTLVGRDGLSEIGSGMVDWKSDRSQAEVRFQSSGNPPSAAQLRIVDYRQAVEKVLELVRQVPGEVVGCGHRVVHGGSHFQESAVIDARVLAILEELFELAPLHNPPAVDAIRAAQEHLPAVKHIAVFDTAFFARLPLEAHLYPLPYEWYTEWGVRRFGFHGISHHYCSQRARELNGREDDRTILCHLGNGCSVSSLAGRTVRGITMGFTPLEGLMMGTRSGSIDPGILFFLMHSKNLTADEIHDALQRKSGLLGVSGLSGDVRTLTEAASQGHERARLALTMFADRVRAAIGALAVQLGGVDMLVFTAGIGEHSAALRAEICRGLECLGIHLDGAKNITAKADADIAAPSSSARIFVIHTREEELIAREVDRLLD